VKALPFFDILFALEFSIRQPVVGGVDFTALLSVALWAGPPHGLALDWAPSDEAINALLSAAEL